MNIKRLRYDFNDYQFLVISFLVIIGFNVNLDRHALATTGPEPPVQVEGKVVDHKTTMQYSGIVQNEAGEPIAGAKVCWFSNQSEKITLNLHEKYHPHTVTTDEEGKFTLYDVNAPKIGVYIEAIGYARCMIAPVLVPWHAYKIKQITLQPGAEVFGRIYENGQPIAFASVAAFIFGDQLNEVLDSGGPTLPTKADDNGFYRLVDLPAGRFPISIGYPLPFGFQYSAQKKIEIEPGDKIELNFGNEDGFTLTGIVKLGESVVEFAGLEIVSSDESYRSTLTDPNGRFCFTNIPSGQHKLHACRWHPDGNYYHDSRQLTINKDLSIDIDFKNPVLMRSPPPMIDTSDRDNNARGVRESVKTFIAAILAGCDKKASMCLCEGVEMTIPYPNPALSKEISDLRETMEGQDVNIVSVYADTNTTLAISSTIRGEHDRTGLLVFRVDKHYIGQKLYWLIRDIELQTHDTLEQEIADFLKKYPDAKKVIFQSLITNNHFTS